MQISCKSHADLMQTQARTSRNRAREPFGPVRARLRLVRACVCMDLYEIFFGNQLISYELKFQIS